MTSFNHIALYVKDLQKSTAFYSSIIGLEQIDEPFKEGKHSWFNMGSHNQLHLIAGRPDGKNDNKEWHFAFTTPDLNEFVETLEDAGISYGEMQDQNRKITFRPDGIGQVYFQDPDGYWIEVNNDRYSAPMP